MLIQDEEHATIIGSGLPTIMKWARVIVIAIIAILVMAAMKDLNINILVRILRGLRWFVFRD